MAEKRTFLLGVDNRLTDFRQASILFNLASRAESNVASKRTTQARADAALRALMEESTRGRMRCSLTGHVITALKP